jgi:hypothetical protein
MSIIIRRIFSIIQAPVFTLIVNDKNKIMACWQLEPSLYVIVVSEYRRVPTFFSTRCDKATSVARGLKTQCKLCPWLNNIYHADLDKNE